MKRLLGALLLAMVCQSQLISAADARPRHRHHHGRSHHVRVTPAPEPAFHSWFGSGGSDVVSAARQYLGSGAVFGRSTLWCATFMNYVLKKTGHHGTGSDLAMSFTSKPATSMRVGAIAVLSRRGGGHVGVVSRIDADGNPVLISGNSTGRRVTEQPYPRSRVVKFVDPA